jgi:hypothetical protein
MKSFPCCAGSSDGPVARAAEDGAGQQEDAAPAQALRDLRRRPQGRLY